MKETARCFSVDVELVVEIGDAERSVRRFDARDCVADESWNFHQRLCGDKVFENGESRAGRFRGHQSIAELTRMCADESLEIDDRIRGARRSVAE